MPSDLLVKLGNQAVRAAILKAGEPVAVTGMDPEHARGTRLESGQFAADAHVLRLAPGPDTGNFNGESVLNYPGLNAQTQTIIAGRGQDILLVGSKDGLNEVLTHAREVERRISAEGAAR